MCLRHNTAVDFLIFMALGFLLRVSPPLPLCSWVTFAGWPACRAPDSREKGEGAISSQIYIKIRKEAEQLFTRTYDRAADQTGTRIKKVKKPPTACPSSSH
jgi:hypothetical protein